MAWIDLHLHSTCSDGAYAPAEVIAMAAEVGLAAAALADHDALDGIAEAQQAGQRLGIEVLSGVELSVVWNDLREIHLLGYGFDPQHPGLCAELDECRRYRMGRNGQILERVNDLLQEHGKAPLESAAVQERAQGTMGRPHIGMALVEAGYAESMDEAFNRYLVPCNVPKRDFAIDKAIELLHAAGGVAVLAHPPFITRNLRRLEAIVEEFLPMGLDGIEAWNSGGSNDEIDNWITLARRKGLIVTGGSDFHGTQPNLEIGRGYGNLRIPYTCVDEIRAALWRLNG
ncbi:MAG: phosphatase [Desulfuromonas sp.]|nr:MAG: phosphatase [Desulfuromonas sp.]